MNVKSIINSHAFRQIKLSELKALEEIISSEPKVLSCQ